MELWDYPINRLLLRVGMALATYLRELPEVAWAERAAVEDRVAQHLELPQAREAELITRWVFRWRRTPAKRLQLRTIRLFVHPKVRKSPGIRIVKKMLFPDLSYWPPPGGPRAQPDRVFFGRPEDALH